MYAGAVKSSVSFVPFGHRGNNLSLIFLNYFTDWVSLCSSGREGLELAVQTRQAEDL